MAPNFKCRPFRPMLFLLRVGKELAVVGEKLLPSNNKNIKKGNNDMV
jgi:hypothetical protein